MLVLTGMALVSFRASSTVLGSPAVTPGVLGALGWCLHPQTWGSWASLSLGPWKMVNNGLGIACFSFFIFFPSSSTSHSLNSFCLGPQVFLVFLLSVLGLAGIGLNFFAAAHSLGLGWERC